MGNQKFPYRGVWHAEQGIGNCFNIFDFRLHSAQYRKIDKFVFFKTPSPVPPCLPRRQCNKFINFELRFPLGAGQSNVHYRIVLLHFNILFDYCQGFFGKFLIFLKILPQNDLYIYYDDGFKVFVPFYLFFLQSATPVTPNFKIENFY